MNLKPLKKVSFSLVVMISISCSLYLNFHGVDNQLFIQDLTTSNLSNEITELSDVNMIKKVLVKVFEFITL